VHEGDVVMEKLSMENAVLNMLT